MCVHAFVGLYPSLCVFVHSYVAAQGWTCIGAVCDTRPETAPLACFAWFLKGHFAGGHQ